MATRLVPYQEGMKLGFGYDLVQGTPLTSPAVEGSTSELKGAHGQVAETYFTRIDDLDELHKILGVTADAGGSYFGASADVKVSYAQECNIATHSTHVLIGLSVADAFENFDSPVLSPDASELLANPSNKVRFRQRFGDVFIDGLRKGGEYFATFEIASVDQEAREDIAVKIEAAYSAGFAAANLQSEIDTRLSAAHGHAELRVHVFQKGSIDRTDLGLQEILDKAHNFPPSVSGYNAAPFAVSLADYTTLKMPSDSFDFLQIENQRDVLADHARMRFAFLKLRNDISYIRLHPEDFDAVDQGKLGDWFARVTDCINVMEHEASSCLRNPAACSFTKFDVSDFPLPHPKSPVDGNTPTPSPTRFRNLIARSVFTR
jgi:hypothetical protein